MLMWTGQICSLPITTKAGSRLVMAVVSGLMLGWTILIARIAYPEILADSPKVRRLEHAASLDANNDAIHYKAGLNEQWNADDVQAAIREYRLAIVANGQKAEYWSALGQACLIAEERSCAAEALTSAVRLAPMRPAYQRDLASYYVVNGDRASAYRQLSSLLSLMPENATSVLSSCLRISGSAEEVWDGVVAPTGNPSTQLAFMTLLEQKNLGATSKYWEIISKHPLDYAAAAPYLDALIQKGDYEGARVVWADVQRKGVIPWGHNKLVYNGSFDNAPLNSGFDWHLPHEPDVELGIERRAQSLSVPNALRVEFTEPDNAEVEPAYEIIPVLGSSNYLLSAQIKSEDITSDSGPRLRVVDAGCPSCLDVSSPPVLGTSDWHEVRLEFSTRSTTKAIRISVHRERARRFPMDINGHLWITAVNLELNNAP